MWGLVTLTLLIGGLTGIGVPVTNFQKEQVVDSAADGAVFDLVPLANLIDIPRTEFTCYAWIYIESMANANGSLMSLTTSASTTFTVKWMDTLLMFDNGGTEGHNILTASARPTGQWFYLNMGTLRGYSYGILAFRAAASTWKVVRWNEKIAVPPNAVFRAPVGAGAFRVRTT